MGCSNLQLKLFSIIAFDIYLALSSSLLSSLFDEKYSLSILDIHDTKTIDFMEEAAVKSLETLTTKSRTGQSFICYLPQAKHVNPDGSSNVSLQVTNADIQSRLKAIDGSQNSVCPMLNQGWWTYEFCFGSEISQFHMDRDKSSVNNVVISLGVFSHETIWDNLTFTPESLKAQQTSLHHIQHYTNGSKCELTGQSRTTKVRFFCGTLFKIQITEPSTCNYLVTVNTPTLCDLPIFRPEETETVEKISCIPEVDLSHLRDKKLKAAESVMKPLQRETEPKVASPLDDDGDLFDESEGKHEDDENGIKEESQGSVETTQTEGPTKLGSESSGKDLDSDDNLLTPRSPEPKEKGSEETVDMGNEPDSASATGKGQNPTLNPFQQEPKVVSTFELDDQMNFLSKTFSKLYGVDHTTIDNGKGQSRKVSLKQRFMDIVLPRKTSAPEDELDRSLLGLAIQEAQRVENDVVMYVDRLGDMIARSEVPAILLTDLKYTLRTIMTLIRDYSKRNIHSLYETVLKSTDSTLTRKLEDLAYPVVHEYIESLGMLSETLTSIEFLVDYYGKFLPTDQKIDEMEYSELKSLYEDIGKQYTLPNSIVKEARAIFNVIERKHPSFDSTAAAVEKKQGNPDTPVKIDQSDATKKKASESGVDSKVLKLLRELVKQARQLAFFEETNLVMSSFYAKQTRGAGALLRDIMEESHVNKLGSVKQGSPQSVTANQAFRSKSTWEDYKKVMTGATQPSGLKTGKTVIKVKMTQLNADETSKLPERGPDDEFTIELEDDEVLEGLDIADVKEMEVHFLAIGSDVDYAKMTKDPAKLAQIVKDALKSGQSMKFEGPGQTGPKTLKTEKEHFELKSRYWDSYKPDGEDQPVDLIDSIKGKITGLHASSEPTSVKDELPSSSSSYSRKYHLI